MQAFRENRLKVWLNCTLNSRVCTHVDGLPAFARCCWEGNADKQEWCCFWVVHNVFIWASMQCLWILQYLGHAQLLAYGRYAKIDEMRCWGDTGVFIPYYNSIYSFFKLNFNLSTAAASHFVNFRYAYKHKHNDRKPAIARVLRRPVLRIFCDLIFLTLVYFLDSF
jgi:hypothetical protein